MTRTVAEVRGLVVRRGKRDVLDGVDLAVRAGEVLGLIGPNGGGKSTLLLALAGLLRPTRGTVTLGGVPAHQVALQSSGKVGLITAAPGLYPLLTGWENLTFFGALYGLSDAETRRRVDAFVRALELGVALDQPVSAGSSGMQQKVSLARALLMDPDLLLLDEPTSNLDPIAADVVHRAARAHADAGHAVVWVTHDLTAAEHICDRVVLVRQRVLHEEVFSGVRDVPPRGPLVDRWRGLLGGAA